MAAGGTSSTMRMSLSDQAHEFRAAVKANAPPKEEDDEDGAAASIGSRRWFVSLMSRRSQS